MHSSKSLLSFKALSSFKKKKKLISSSVLPSVTDQVGFKPALCQVLQETLGDGEVNKTSIVYPQTGSTKPMCPWHLVEGREDKRVSGRPAVITLDLRLLLRGPGYSQGQSTPKFPGPESFCSESGKPLALPSSRRLEAGSWCSSQSRGFGFRRLWTQESCLSPLDLIFFTICLLFSSPTEPLPSHL